MQFEFIADYRVLDFVATVAERGTTDLEQLVTRADLARWVAESGITTDRVKVTTEQLTHAKALREAMYGLIAALIGDTAGRPADRHLVNAAAAHPRPVVQLSSSGDVSRHGGIETVLGALAQDCIELFDGPDREALRWCADPRCTRPFVDRSRGHRRRWCDMKGCGDRAKARAYRRRHRTDHVGG